MRPFPFLLGLSPFIPILAGRIKKTSFLADNVADASFLAKGIERGRELLVHWFPQSGAYPDLGPIPGAWAAKTGIVLAGIVYLGAIVLLVRGLLRRGEADSRPRALRALPLVAYVPAFVFAYCFLTTRLSIKEYAEPVREGTFRYFVTGYSMLALLGGGVWAALWQNRATRVPACIGGGLALALGAFSLPMIDWRFQDTGLGLRYPGYCWRYYSGTLMRDSMNFREDGSIDWDLDRVHGQLADFRPHEMEPIAVGIGYQFAMAAHYGEMLGKGTEGWDLDTMLAPFSDPHLRRAMARGIGSYLRRPLIGVPVDWAALQTRLDALEAHATRELPDVYEGLATQYDFPLKRLMEGHFGYTREVGGHVPEARREPWLRGVGRQLAERLPIFPELTADAVEQANSGLTEAEREQVYRGLGLGLADREEVPGKAELWRGHLPAEALQPVLRGMGEAYGRRMAADWEFPGEWRERLTAEEWQALEQGLALARREAAGD
ncbi:MAG: hypothetical protein R3E96_12230 [Planctomycetota bacterium]